MRSSRPVSTPPQPNRPLVGIAWMLVTGICFVAVTAIVKHLGDSVPPAQAAFLRYLLGLVFLIPMIGAMRAARLDSWSVKLLLFRGVIHSAAVALWFFSMARITIAEVTALNYLAPIYVTLGAAVFLGEKLALRRLAAIAVALGGAMIILRPGFRALDPGHFAMMATAIFMGGSYLIAKHMSGQTSASVIVGFLSITVTIGLAPLAFAVWVPVSFGDLVWLFVVAAFATLGHYTMTLSFAAAPVAVTQPVTFLQLLWATLIGIFVFLEPADRWVLIGGTVILGAVCFITWRETMLKRKVIAPPSVATKT
ncbi:MAG: DMT family transporter [Pseudomonadota bacterium]